MGVQYSKDAANETTKRPHLHLDSSWIQTCRGVQYIGEEQERFPDKTRNNGSSKRIGLIADVTLRRLPAIISTKIIDYSYQDYE